MVHSLAPVSNLYWLNEICPEHYSAVGYKAFYLSQLLQKGYPVVPGLVVSSLVLRSFLETLDWANPLFADLPGSSLHLNLDNPPLLQAISHQFRQAIATAQLSNDLLQELESAAIQLQSPSLILRPSLIVEPGEGILEHPLLTSDLNLKSSSLFSSQFCKPERNSLAEALKKIWSDFLSAKSLFYWQRMKTQLHRVNLAVLVQPIQSAIASGTLRQIVNQIEVCATVGLGMAIARGEVTPDVHLINSKTGVVDTQQLGQKNIAYGFSWTTTTPNAECDFLNLQGDEDNSENLLKVYLLNEQQQATFALSEVNLHHLVQMHQRIATELRTEIELEWIFSHHEADSQLSLTQVIPQLPEPTYQVKSSQVLEGIGASKPNKPESLELFPGSTLIATGLPVSPGQMLAQTIVLTDSNGFPDSIPPHTVLVASAMPLDWMPLIQTAAALVIEQGGMTSHCAIVARELNIPAVMGLPNITQQIRSGELLWVDGDRGTIYRLPQSAGKLNEEKLVQRITFPRDSTPSSLSSSTLCTHLMVNASQPEHLQALAGLPVQGVGLLRAEILALSILDSQHPLLWLQQKGANEFVERLANGIRAFANAFKPRPVLYRSFDLRSHEFYSLSEGDSRTVNANPMLGVRGTFSYLLDPTLFQLELQALAAVQQDGYDNVHLMLPFVRTVEEFQACRQWVEQVGLLHHPNFQLWIMAEVPSVLLLLPDYVKAGVQGISIGTNDLTQLLLGVDRDQAQLAIAFDERHPSIKRALFQLIRQSHELGIPCSICGEAPVRYPELIDDLVRWGITSISVAPNAVKSIAEAIAQAERNLLPEFARSQIQDF